MKLDCSFYPDEWFNCDVNDINIPASSFFKTCDDEIDDNPLPNAKKNKFELDFGIVDFNIKKS